MTIKRWLMPRIMRPVQTDLVLTPHVVFVSPFARHRPDSRLRLELCNQLCEFFVEVGVKPATMREIQVDARLV